VADQVGARREQHPRGVRSPNKAALPCAADRKPFGAADGAWLWTFPWWPIGCYASIAAKQACAKLPDLGTRRTTQARVLRKVLKTLDLDETPLDNSAMFCGHQRSEGTSVTGPSTQVHGIPTPPQLSNLIIRPTRTLSRPVSGFCRALVLRARNCGGKPRPSGTLSHALFDTCVDEFQDTNADTYQWLMLLATPTGMPFSSGRR